jgi:hypothetical protein
MSASSAITASICLAAATIAVASTALATELATVVVDAFDDASVWEALPADGVGLTLSTDAVEGDAAMRLDFRFTGGGYAVARRELALPLPENYTFSFLVRGTGPSNHLEFKLVDGTGENVWWNVHRDFEFSPEYVTVRIKKRQIGFAWGPLGGGEIDTVRAIEFAITAGTGGTGSVWIDDLELTPMPPAERTLPSTQALMSANPSVAAAVDGDLATSWIFGKSDEPSTSSGRTDEESISPAPAERGPFRIDLGRSYEFGGIVIDWGDSYPTSYVVELSSDGKSWPAGERVERSNGDRDWVLLPESEARFVRVRSFEPGLSEGARWEIRELALRSLEQFSNRQALFHEIAAENRRGLYPRGIWGEQSYWTVVGPDYDSREVLVGEEGAVELWAGGPSVEPFLQVDGELATWSDVELHASLEDGYLPIPIVRWDALPFSLEVTTVPVEDPNSASILVRYRVTNRAEVARHGDLVLAVRPFQVNPPSQSLNLSGGIAQIHTIAADPHGALVDGRCRIELAPPAHSVGVATFAGGDIVAEHLGRGRIPEHRKVTDPFGGASAAFRFPMQLEPAESHDVVLRFPLTPAGASEDPLDRPEDLGPGRAAEELASASLDSAPLDSATFDAALDTARESWHERIDRVRIELPESGRKYLETARAQIGFILVNRAGPAIQPGARSYARSWIRDGSLTSSALLRMGHAEAAREFLDWFAPHQFENGKIPCVVDWRGADPVPEHDSSGEFIFLVAELYRYTGDREMAERHWPRVLAAAEYLDSLRQERRTGEYAEIDLLPPEKRAFYGLLPPSISHEGYSAKPMHSYWDDFFALRGFKDAAFLAGELGKESERVVLESWRDEFARELGASIEAAQAFHGIDYVPGCADLGDFDPTSTTIALTPVGVDGVVSLEDLESTFSRYLQFFRERVAASSWDAYTPYELRNVGAFVRLGWRKEAHELMEFFFEDQRPAGWVSWAEVISREERQPRFIGDLPHTWVGSDYVRSFLDMFVAFDPDGQSARVGAGIPLEWIEGPGVLVEELSTPWGTFGLRIVLEDPRTMTIQISGDASTPPQGWIIDPPLPEAPQHVLVNGSASSVSGRRIRIDELPAEIVITW